MNKAKRVIDGYVMKRQSGGGFKVVEFSHKELNGNPVTQVTKKTIKKGMSMSDAENLIFMLENKR